MKTFCKYISISFGIVLITSSCTSYSHSYRLSNINETDVSLADKIGVTMNIDIDKTIKATSNQHKSVKDAKDEAYFKAITENNISVLVDPIYSVETTSIFLNYGKKSRATVVGFAGYYVDPKPYKTTLAELEEEKIARKQQEFNRTLGNLDYLIKNNVISSQNSETVTLACNDCGLSCSDCSKSVVKGGLYEIVKTNNKSSIIDEYNNFVSGLSVEANESISLSQDDNSETKSDESNILNIKSNSKILNLLKLPLRLVLSPIKKVISKVKSKK